MRCQYFHICLLSVLKFSPNVLWLRWQETTSQQRTTRTSFSFTRRRNWEMSRFTSPTNFLWNLCYSGKNERVKQRMLSSTHIDEVMKICKKVFDTNPQDFWKFPKFQPFLLLVGDNVPKWNSLKCTKHPFIVMNTKYPNIK